MKKRKKRKPAVPHPVACKHYTYIRKPRNSGK